MSSTATRPLPPQRNTRQGKRCAQVPALESCARSELPDDPPVAALVVVGLEDHCHIIVFADGGEVALREASVIPARHESADPNAESITDWPRPGDAAPVFGEPVIQPHRIRHDTARRKSDARGIGASKETLEVEDRLLASQERVRQPTAAEKSEAQLPGNQRRAEGEPRRQQLA